MQGENLPTRRKASQSTFEFVDGRPLTTEQKLKSLSKVRSKARKWQLEQRKVAANGNDSAYKDAKEDGEECEPGVDESLDQSLWDPKLFFASSDESSTMSEYSPVNSASPGTTHSQTSWNDSYSSQTMSESSPDCDSPCEEIPSIPSAKLAISVIQDGRNWIPSLGSSKIQDTWSRSTAKSHPFAVQGGLDEEICRQETIPNGPCSFLGAGTIDPFMTYSSKLPGFLVAKYIGCG
jgi:hypothetical protein